MQSSILERRVSKHTNSTRVNAFLFCCSDVLLCIPQWLQSRLTLLMLYLHPQLLMKCHCSVEDSRNTINNLLNELPREIIMSRFTHSPHLCCKNIQKQNFLFDHIMQRKTGYFMPALHISAVCFYWRIFLSPERCNTQFNAVKCVFIIRPLTAKNKLRKI